MLRIRSAEPPRPRGALRRPLGRGGPTRLTRPGARSSSWASFVLAASRHPVLEGRKPRTRSLGNLAAPRRPLSDVSGSVSHVQPCRRFAQRDVSDAGRRNRRWGPPETRAELLGVPSCSELDDDDMRIRSRFGLIAAVLKDMLRRSRRDPDIGEQRLQVHLAPTTGRAVKHGRTQTARSDNAWHWPEC